MAKAVVFIKKQILQKWNIYAFSEKKTFYRFCFRQKSFSWAKKKISPRPKQEDFMNIWAKININLDVFNFDMLIWFWFCPQPKYSIKTNLSKLCSFFLHKLITWWIWRQKNYHFLFKIWPLNHSLIRYAFPMGTKVQWFEE